MENSEVTAPIAHPAKNEAVITRSVSHSTTPSCIAEMQFLFFYSGRETSSKKREHQNSSQGNCLYLGHSLGKL